MNEASDPRRQIPSVDTILNALASQGEMSRFSHQEKVEAIRNVLDSIRSDGNTVPVPSLQHVVETVSHHLRFNPVQGLRRVVNGTGIILHTGLGRAALPRSAVEAVSHMEGYCNLQIQLEDGSRGKRDGIIERYLQILTSAEAATVVNNNAAATLLVLAALCAGKEVIVSRGQLIEIGGSFRLPDVIQQSGARMVEVGTTNKTHGHDYANAIGENTGVLLRVNPSNYRITGFTQSVSIAELVELKQEHELIVVDDLGCGALVDLSQYGLPSEPTVQDSLQAGADVALFSGDKLISGPQAGIVAGKKKYIDLIRKHPLARALRVGKLTLAALEATLRLFLEPDRLLQTHPTLRMMTRTYEELRCRAAHLKTNIKPWVDCEIIEGESACGGGSLPDYAFKTALLALSHQDYSADSLAQRLRTSEPAVIPRIWNQRVCIDIRTLLDGDEERIIAALKNL